MDLQVPHRLRMCFGYNLFHRKIHRISEYLLRKLMGGKQVPLSFEKRLMTTLLCRRVNDDSIPGNNHLRVSARVAMVSFSSTT